MTDLDVTPDLGLSPEEARLRLDRFGPNLLMEEKKKGALMIFVRQFKSLIMVLLAAAAGLSFAFGDFLEAIAIIVVILINALIGFFTELQAIRSMESLKKLTSVTTRVKRAGRVLEIHARDLVPGDIVLLEGGDIVSADLRLITSSRLLADESALTGESLPVDKAPPPVAEKAPLAERLNMLYAGTAVTRGSAEAVVVSTGMNTELGHITSLVSQAKQEATPLEKRLDELGRTLIWVTLAVAVVVAVSGILSGKQILMMIETGIALAVAAIPEGLPIVATIALARGMFRMAQKNAIINRLSAVETLGATNVICTDKTGTLTENRMTVTRIGLSDGDVDISGEAIIPGTPPHDSEESPDPLSNPLLVEALRISVLCNNANLNYDNPAGNDGHVGDPLEIALLSAGFKAQIWRQDLIGRMPRVGEEAFDSDVKMMATFHEMPGGYYVAVKGAPEPIAQASSYFLTRQGKTPMGNGERSQWLERSAEMAREGLRVIALAMKMTDSPDTLPYDNLVFVGLVGMLDPPRADVPGALARCRDAGIRVIMVTGDQAVTAKNIALDMGLVSDRSVPVINGADLKNPGHLTEREKAYLLSVSIFARVSPKQKLDLIELHQKNGSVVAMTGDGVNDAPALKKADIGIAMGLRGTQVAREAADMVLKDDAFPTIVTAVEQGRVIYNNIRTFVRYLFACNMSEILTVFLASLLTVPLPILPLQILFLNLVTDVFPALALGVGRGDPSIMGRPPRDGAEPLLTKRHWMDVFGAGLVITASVLTALMICLSFLGFDNDRAVTVSFMTLAFSQLWHVFNMGDDRAGFFVNDITKNPYIWGALVLCGGLLVAGVYVPIFSRVLRLYDPGMNGWAVILGMSLVVLITGSAAKAVRRRRA
ncbi:MAG: cation-translocating P-type ATPase [Deltaproteobacteria bacterium]|nr:cation-translocating P-type ATPase [Candidatus Zymogenaceae bacterium]